MHLKSLFSEEHATWLPQRPEFLAFTHKCWNAETNKTLEIFSVVSRILSSMYWLFLNSSKKHLFGECYATSVFTYSTEKKPHAS